MIITEKVEVKITNSNIREFYKNLGYNTDFYKIEVLVKHLLKNSHVVIDVRCDICGGEKKLKYLKYTKNILKHGIYTCNNSCAQIKNRMTSIEKFGIDHHSKTDNHRKKISTLFKGKFKISFEDRICPICKNTFNINVAKNKITCSKTCYHKMINEPDYKNMIKLKTEKSLMKNYGVTNQYQRDDIIEKLRKIRIDKGIEIPNKDLTDWMKYKRIVNKLTKRNRNKVFEMWNGYDYYDNEYIKDNMKLSHTDNNYPNIDHKISIFHGFKNKIDPIKISDMNNLCITKRILNIRKRTKTEDDFILIVHN